MNRIVGVLFRTVATKETPPTASVHTQIYVRNGDLKAVSLYIGLHHVRVGPDQFTTYDVYRFVPEVEQKEDTTVEPAEEVTPAISAEEAAAQLQSLHSGRNSHQPKSGELRAQSSSPESTSKPQPSAEYGRLPIFAIPSPLTSSHIFPGGISPENEVVVATCSTEHGEISMYTSPLFERNVVDRAEIDKGRRQRTQLLAMMLPEKEVDKVDRFPCRMSWNMLISMKFSGHTGREQLDVLCANEFTTNGDGSDTVPLSRWEHYPSFPCGGTHERSIRGRQDFKVHDLSVHP